MFGDLTVKENLELGALALKVGRERDESPPGRGLGPLPETGGKDQAAHQHPVRRRAADGGHGPGLDGQAAPAAAGRAQPGAGPLDRRRGLRYYSSVVPGRGHHPAGGAERRPGPGRLEVRLSAGQRPDRRPGRQRGPAGGPGTAPGLPGGGLGEQPGGLPPRRRGTHQYQTGEAELEPADLYAAFQDRGRTSGPPATGIAVDGAPRL